MNIFKKVFNKNFALLALILISFSCSREKKAETVETSYLKAVKSLNSKDYLQAAKSFEKVGDDFPFSKWGLQAQLMSAYSYYQNGDYEDVGRVVDDFIRVNPNHPDTPYMMYMKGLSYYEQMPNIRRAQDKTRLASLTFRELSARFPSGTTEIDYASDAKDKLKIIDEHLAGWFMSVGRYEASNENYVGAIKNYTRVLESYMRTTQSQEALFRLNEIYLKIGMKDQAKIFYDALEGLFPGSYWASAAQKNMKKYGSDS